MPKRDWVESYFSSQSISVSFNSDDALVIIDTESSDDKRFASKWKLTEDSPAELLEVLVENNGDEVEETAITSVPLDHIRMKDRVAKKLGMEN